ncbi:hypothetical protein [Planomicrobium sp. CPCC 101110]|uniref:hypothetical protein n=1 Tax=Planomicrobium sp. CPCC 101110 TaxID=2599619 RepID=UPI0011B75CA7|nr:hypothetical protein [Planomicrobium sp. CPCC 101110]TWT25229.1 hypothetical protein FQV30_12735 [Planomicrobium sp. CPCC 101110]
MKKIVSIVLVMSLFLGFSTNVFAAAGDRQYEQGVQIIENANIAIDAKIALAVEQADGLQSDYLSKIRSIEQSEIFKLEQEKESLKAAVQSGSYSKADVIEMNKKIAELEEKIAVIAKKTEINVTAIQQDIEAFMSLVGTGTDVSNQDLYAAIESLTAKLNSKSNKYVAATNVYVKQLDVVIKDCYDVTLLMSNDAIEKAGKKGVLAECSWKLVRFGHQWVWIDPIRIVGRH